MSLVVPAYNEQDRLHTMLKEAIEYLHEAYGTTHGNSRASNLEHANGNTARIDSSLANGNLKHRSKAAPNGRATPDLRPTTRGWEILVISDGSTDDTVQTALSFAKTLGREAASAIRVVQLVENRGKGGAVVQGMKHVRGKYAIFADADGASKFEDLGKLVKECRANEDDEGRAVAVGSRAHLVGSDAVVKVHQSTLLSRIR